MGEIVIPLDLVGYMTIPGTILLAALIGLWARDALPDWRWTPWVVLGTCEFITILLRLIVDSGHPEPQPIALTAIFTFVGVSIETYGYEAIMNALGAAGIGRRSEQAQIQTAKDIVYPPSAGMVQ